MLDFLTELLIAIGSFQVVRSDINRLDTVRYESSLSVYYCLGNFYFFTL